MSDTDAADKDASSDFIEQAEYISRRDFAELNAQHPDEITIVRKLSGAGAKLLVGPRGCGKTTLLFKTYYGLLDQQERTSLPVYVNFKLSLKLEPLYINTANASFWFRQWLMLMVLHGLHKTFEDGDLAMKQVGNTDIATLEEALNRLESGNPSSEGLESTFSLTNLVALLKTTMEIYGFTRCVLLLDDAAHAFSPRQQEDFFEFFREVKSSQVSPKAAIYPGITNHSPTFHVGHDAEQIEA